MRELTESVELSASPQVVQCLLFDDAGQFFVALHHEAQPTAPPADVSPWLPAAGPGTQCVTALGATRCVVFTKKVNVPPPLLPIMGALSRISVEDAQTVVALGAHGDGFTVASSPMVKMKHLDRLITRLELVLSSSAATENDERGKSCVLTTRHAFLSVSVRLRSRPTLPGVR